VVNIMSGTTQKSNPLVERRTVEFTMVSDAKSNSCHRLLRELVEGEFLLTLRVVDRD
jgi:hypothetical protein